MMDRQATFEQPAPNLTPRMSVRVTIRGGPPPADLATRAPGVSADALAKLERALFDRLEADPTEAARYLRDPIGVLRRVAPQSTELLAALEAAYAAAASTVPDAPD